MPPIVFADPVFLEHQTGDHPECPARLESVYARLSESAVMSKFVTGDFRPASIEDLTLVHGRDYVNLVRAFAAQGGGRIEADTMVSSRSFEVACKAVGAALSAVDTVFDDEAPPVTAGRQAVCLIRPPGHHALRDAAMGFCLFNNVAIAAEYALHQYQLDRVLVVDWDVHHGNGTQDIFYASERVWFLSAHRHPFYPGSGLVHETGTGAGLGTKFNLPIRFGTLRSEYLEQFATVFEQAVTKCRPDLILISAGFDAHRADPVGSLGLETEDYEPLTKLVLQGAREYCDGRLVSLLEGGYNVRALAECVECHMQTLAASA